MQRYASMRDAYNSIYESNCNSKKKSKKQSVKEALDTLIESGIINEDELKSLMERQETDLDKMTRQLKVSNAPRVKPANAPSKPLGDKKIPGMMDHSKKND